LRYLNPLAQILYARTACPLWDGRTKNIARRALWGTSPGSSTALDLYAGGRAWWQRGEVNLAVSGTAAMLKLISPALPHFRRSYLSK
jgi:hypothetical protein